ncbi:heme exporter protein CcmB [Myxococcota bacterium]|nr:heme exporter protein CcmB [Myxococcota bacterium]MBU1432842.1 heme exporter protein CcmB [Myxococcota bacterium]MBU1897526.1 heme exporter protein CcmB [Myxococcota bacterium]
MSAWLSVFWAILAKDLRVELRSKQTLAMMTLFGFVLTAILAYGLVSDPATNRVVYPGALWIALLFTGALGIGRTFAQEAAFDAFSALVLSPAPREAILLAKILGNLLLILMVMALVAPLIAVMLHLNFTGEEAGLVALHLLLSALGFVVVGTPLAVMATSARFAEVLLPLVVFPLVSPVLISGVKGVGVALGTTTGDDPWSWIQLTLAFDVVYGAGGLLLFSKMVSE